MKDIVRDWMGKKEPAKIMPRASAETQEMQGIVVERLFDPETRDEGIRLTIDPSNNEWQETPIGNLRVDPIETFQTRRGIRSSIRIHFTEEGTPEFLQSGRGESGMQGFKKMVRSREIPLYSNGIGWDELGRKDTTHDELGRKPDQWQKWLIVDTGGPIMSMISEDMRAAAD